MSEQPSSEGEEVSADHVTTQHPESVPPQTPAAAAAAEVSGISPPKANVGPAPKSGTKKHPNIPPAPRPKQNQNQVAASPAAVLRSQQSSSSASSRTKKRALGESAGIALLLSNHKSFGLAERVCYHFDLLETLRRDDSGSAGGRVDSTATGAAAEEAERTTVRNDGDKASPDIKHTSRQQHQQLGSEATDPISSSFCGVSALLECVPQIPPNKQTKKSRRLLRNRLKEFNLQARLFRSASDGGSVTRSGRGSEQIMATPSPRFGTRCYQPSALPLRPKPTTRVTFAYELTSIVICLDASSTVTSTFGNLGSHHSVDGAVCALDRMGGMVRRYLSALIEPVPGAAAINRSKGGPTPSTATKSGTFSSKSSGGGGTLSWWIPELRVTVLAAFPRASSLGGGVNERSTTSLLVRDYRVTDAVSAEELADAVDEWVLTEIEGEIASRLAKAGGRSNDHVDSMMTSSLRDIIEVCDDALASTLPPEGKPTVVLCTDCRSVVCDSILDTLAEIRRTDVPLHVLDLSAPHSHQLSGVSGRYQTSASDDAIGGGSTPSSQLDFLALDDDGPETFPLGFSDDAEALYDVCRATCGCFLDRALLDEAARTVVGQVSSDSVLHGDHYLSFRRRSLRPNTLQWYTIFCLSPLAPLYNASWGRLPPPAYLCKKTSASDSQQAGLHSLRSLHQGQQDKLVRQGNHSRTTFSVYPLSPVRVKSILLLRIIEGFRSRRYGQNTEDADKVSVHLTVPLEHGTVLHYELSYLASTFYNVMVGSAHVKVELSGDPLFIQSVKNDFMNHQLNLQQRARHGTIAQRASAKLCKFMRWIRKEDCLDSDLTPLEWGEKLGAGSPFLRRLGTMSTVQRHRHFDIESFEVVCVGGDPFSNQESLLSEFMEEESGENELLEALADFATQTVTDRTCYVLKLPPSRRDLVTYCVIEVIQSPDAARLYTIALEFFGCPDNHERVAVAQKLKKRLYSCEFVVLLPRTVDQYIRVVMQGTGGAGGGGSIQKARGFLHWAHWDLTNDDELIPILCQRRRSSIGNFWLFDSSQNHALLGKFVAREGIHAMKHPSLHLVLYYIRARQDSVSVDIYMETQRGYLNPFCFYPRSNCASGAPTEFFQQVKHRDFECALALKSRRRLLGVFAPEESPDTERGNEASLAKEQEEDISRLLTYASSATKQLRFFKPGSGEANNELAALTSKTILSAAFASNDITQLLISPESKVGGCEEGSWFLVRHDNHTLSLVHLASRDDLIESEKGSGEVHRRLTFHTVYASDLYQTKDDFEDEVEEHEEEHAEHLGVSEFADAVERAHARNYARALYLALRSKERKVVEKVDPDDFFFVTNSCVEMKVADFYISARPIDTEKDEVSSTSTALSSLIATMLESVPGGGAYFYYTGEEATDILTDNVPSGFDRIHDLSVPYGGTVSISEISASEISPPGNEDDVMSFSSEENDQGHLAFAGESGSAGRVDATDDLSSQSASPPILVRFRRDGKEVSLDDLVRLQSSSSLSAFMTLYSNSDTDGTDGRAIESSHLPRVHAAVAMKLVSELKSFVADQTLERLRQVGSNISEIDLRTAILSLLEANNVASSKMSLEFFVAESDELVPASAPTGNEGLLDNFLTLLCSEIEKQRTVKLKRITEGGGDFFVTSEGDSPLPYWCFVQLQRGLGRIILNVHHPRGVDRATEVAERTKAAIRQVCRRVNQIMLLESLHRTRNASYMLIKEDGDKKGEDHKTKDGHESHHPHHHQHQGEFACPVKFQMTFFLYHRCSRSAALVALESKVLHNFAVSNRRGLFVYKDEEENVFYMRLSSFVNEDSSTEGILLLVHGAAMPGPSITVQLCRLLERMLFSISLEALSSVLTKNPFYPLLQVDIAFIREFESKWTALTENDEAERKDASSTESDRIYEFPENVDPMLVLMYFRQNICGSGFFHHLNEAELEDGSDSDVEAVVPLKSETAPEDDGVDLPFAPKHFALFYNNSPSQVDPTYQPVSTLTVKGDEYRKKSGSGIALVGVELLRSNGTPVGWIPTGASPNARAAQVNYPMELLRMRRVGHSSESTSTSSTTAAVSHRVCIRITNTLLDAAILHNWIELSLNQSLVGYRIQEVILQSRQTPLLSFYVTSNDEVEGHSTLARSVDINNLCRGVPALHSIIMRSFDLPHPALARIELKKNPVKATLLAPLTLSLLDQGLLEAIHSDKKGSGLGGVSIIRTSMFPTKTCEQVSLTRDARAGSVRVSAINQKGQTKVIDRPMDSPEYIVAFGLGRQGEDMADTKKRRSSSLYSQLVFRELVIEESSPQDIFEQKLSELKAAKPELFSRSLAFILHVRRSSRIVYVYNWKQTSLSSVIKRLENIEEEVIRSDKHLASVQQARCLRGLDLFKYLDVHNPAGFTASSTMEPSKSEKATGNMTGGASSEGRLDPAAKKDQAKESSTDKRAATATGRKIRRPTNILKPTLIGKSVEGSAMQALAASRARASARTMPGQLRGQSAVSGRANTKQHKERQASATPLKNAGSKGSTKPRKDATPVRKEGIGHQKTLSLTTRPSDQTSRHVAEKPYYKTELIPAALVEYYSGLRSMYCSAVLKRRIPVSVSQALVAKFMIFIQKHKDALDELKFMLAHATPLYSSSCEISQCGIMKVVPFLSSFAQSILKRNRNSVILSSHDSDKPALYVKQDLAGSRSCKAILIVELTATKHNTTQQFIGRCRCWLFLQSPEHPVATGTKRRSTRRFRGGKSKRKHNIMALTKQEKSSSALYSMATYYCENLNMRSEFFNFSASLLKTFEQTSIMPNPLQLLRTLINRYPPFFQRELPNLRYRVHKDKLIFGTFLHCNKKVSVETAQLFGYLCLHPPSEWNAVECTSSQRVLMGDIHGSEVPARFFLTYNDNDGGEDLELFLICEGEGSKLDTYVFGEGQVYAERFIAKIFRQAHVLARHAIRLAAINLRRDTLWANHSLAHNFDATSVNAEEAMEMCQLSSQTSLTMLDSRLSSLLSDKNDLNVNWPSLFFSMRQDTLFSHCFTFEGPGKGAISYLFHFAREDIFLLFELGTDGNMLLGAKLLLREEISDDVAKATKRKAVELGVNWILNFLWHNL